MVKTLIPVCRNAHFLFMWMLVEAFCRLLPFDFCFQLIFSLHHLFLYSIILRGPCSTKNPKKIIETFRLSTFMVDLCKETSTKCGKTDLQKYSKLMKGQTHDQSGWKFCWWPQGHGVDSSLALWKGRHQGCIAVRRKYQDILWRHTRDDRSIMGCQCVKWSCLPYLYCCTTFHFLAISWNMPYTFLEKGQN